MALKDKLVDDWRSSWKWWSMRLNVAAGFLVTIVLGSPDILTSTLNSMPPEIRAIFPPAVGIALTAAVAAVRLWKQTHPPCPPTDGK